jgi:hypothetical protein
MKASREVIFKFGWEFFIIILYRPVSVKKENASLIKKKAKIIQTLSLCWQIQGISRQTAKNFLIPA